MAVRTVAVGPKTSGGGSGAALHGVGFDLDTPLDIGPINQSAAQALTGGSPQYVLANAEDPATGQDMILDIEISTDGGATWTSIFPSGNASKIVLTAGSKAVFEFTSFAISSIAKGNKFRPTVIQVGSGNPGGYVSINFVWS